MDSSGHVSSEVSFSFEHGYSEVSSSKVNLDNEHHHEPTLEDLLADDSSTTNANPETVRRETSKSPESELTSNLSSESRLPNEEPEDLQFQQWEQRIESLKSRERELRYLPQSPGWRLIQLGEEGSELSEFMAPKLHWAILGGDVTHFLSVLEKLCSKPGVYVSDIAEKVSRGGNTILHVAVQNRRSDILRLMTKHFPRLISRTNITGDTALHLAARNKDNDSVEIILSCFPHRYDGPGRVIPNELALHLLRKKNEFGNTALHEAVTAHNYKGTSLLFEANREVVDYQNKEGKSPAYLSVETGQAHKFLVKASFDWGQKMHQGTSPLHAAIIAMSSGRKSKHKFNSLLTMPETKATAFPPSRGSFSGTGRLSRRQSVYSDDEGWGTNRAKNFYLRPTNYCAQILDMKFGLIYLKDEKGGTPLHFAASMGNLEAVLTILDARPPIALEWDLKGRLPIHIACKKGHVNVVKTFVEKGEQRFDPLELLNEKGQNILHIAAKNGKDKVVKYILTEKKLEKLLNQRDKNGNTPLHLASKYLHPNILLLLTQEKRININQVNNQGMTARDIVLLRRGTPPTLRENLSFAILKSLGIPLSEHGRKIRRSQTDPLPIEMIKDRVNTILVVAVLVATVTFAAGFTMPGGIHNSDHIDPKKRGMAALVNRKMFKTFTICDAIAMYSSTMGSFILLWAQLGNFHMAFNATHIALYLVGLALITMSVAFMAAVYLVVGNVPWLAGIVMSIGIIFLLMFLGAFILLTFPLGERGLFFGRISDFIFKIMITLSGSYGKLPKMKASEETERDKVIDEPHQGSAEMVVRRRMLERRYTI